MLVAATPGHQGGTGSGDSIPIPESAGTSGAAGNGPDRRKGGPLSRPVVRR